MLNGSALHGKLPGAILGCGHLSLCQGALEWWSGAGARALLSGPLHVESPSSPRPPPPPSPSLPFPFRWRSGPLASQPSSQAAHSPAWVHAGRVCLSPARALTRGEGRGTGVQAWWPADPAGGCGAGGIPDIPACLPATLGSASTLPSLSCLGPCPHSSVTHSSRNLQGKACPSEERGTGRLAVRKQSLPEFIVGGQESGVCWAGVLLGIFVSS